MDKENEQPTEAELQIERLRRLKEQKDSKEKTHKEEIFMYAELPHVVSNQEPHPDNSSPEKPAETPRDEACQTAPEAKEIRNVNTSVQPRQKKHQCVSKLGRRNFEKINDIVKTIKSANKSIRLSDDMIINMVLARFVELNLDFSGVQNAEDVKAVISKIKADDNANRQI
jgi:hypothetical protein